jgi:N-acetylglucosamine-6-phosphate deacetylase
MNAAIGNTVRFSSLALEEVLPMASTLPAHFLGTEPAGKIVADWDPVTSCLSVKEIFD